MTDVPKPLSLEVAKCFNITGYIYIYIALYGDSPSKIWEMNPKKNIKSMGEWTAVAANSENRLQ